MRDSRYDLIDFERMEHGCDCCEYTGSQRRMQRHLKRWHSIAIDEDDACLHCYVHPDEKPEIASIHLPPIYLKRYGDGGVEAYHCILDFGRITQIFTERRLTGQPDSEGEDLMWDSGDDI
ncbi:hypothetical protein C8Q80DRAFT_84215 [Daedaleopsis nitida]|nr:hypothetical protein C8Q80DRAFT_84215 [Daedaleopsis nitida]